MHRKLSATANDAYSDAHSDAYSSASASASAATATAAATDPRSAVSRRGRFEFAQ